MRSVPERDRSKNAIRKLLEEARQEFSEIGYEDARTPRVAERSGVPAGTPYRYFRDKQNLPIKLTEDLMKMEDYTITRPASAAVNLPPQQAFMEGLARYLDVLASQWDILNIFMEASCHDAEFMRMSWRWEFRAVEILAAYLSSVFPELPGDARAAALVTEYAGFRTMVLSDLYGCVGRKAGAERNIILQLLAIIARYPGFEDLRVPGSDTQQEIQVKSKG